MFLYCSYMPPPETLRKFARRMRHEPTFNERKLWRLLRDRRLDGLKFRRQVPIGPYIVDFVCFARRIIVEADGPTHEKSTTDATRDAWLIGQKFQVPRFSNSTITLYPDLVLDEIRWRAGLLFEPPHPSRFAAHLLPQGEKEV
jgi:very-short-patch-repair endonuclease